MYKIATHEMWHFTTEGSKTVKRTTYYFRASTILVAVTAAALMAVLLLAQKPAEAGVVIGGDLCLSGDEICPPETYIIAGPSQNETRFANSDTFQFSSSESGSTFECKLDGAASFASCSSSTTYSALSDGPHTLEVRAKDPQGDVDPSPASRSWMVEASAPRVSSTSPVKGAAGVAPTANVTATFSEAMEASETNGDPSTITGKTFMLVELNADGTTKARVRGASVSYDASNKTATLDPASDLSLGATYKAVVTTGAQDLAGKFLDQMPATAGNQNKSWKFTVQ
jgi:hypothetical protein